MLFLEPWGLSWLLVKPILLSRSNQHWFDKKYCGQTILIFFNSFDFLAVVNSFGHSGHILGKLGFWNFLLHYENVELFLCVPVEFIIVDLASKDECVEPDFIFV